MWRDPPSMSSADSISDALRSSPQPSSSSSSAAAAAAAAAKVPGAMPMQFAGKPVFSRRPRIH